MAQKVIKTLARQSQDELLEETNNSPLLQQPFATRKYDMTSARLETTREEINILTGTLAVARTGFEQDDTNKTILIPTIFAKINGLPTDEKKYWQHLDKIRDATGLQALVSRHIQASDWLIENDDYNDLMQDLSIENLQNSEAWAYNILNKDLQNKIAKAITDLFADWPFTIPPTDETKQLVLSVTLDLPQELLEMASEVDYPKEVPLLAFVHQESLGEMDFEDIIALNFFHELGWDIEIYSPHNYASIENYMNDDTYDSFSYETVRATNGAKGDAKPSFIKRLFG